MKVRGNEVARGSVMAGHQLALDPGDAVGQLAGIPTTEPAFGLPAVWIPDPARAEAEALGYTVVDAESVIVTHLTETIRGHVAELLTRQDVRALLDRLKESNAAVVEEVVPELLSVGEIQRVLQALLREGVSIRDLGAIVEAVGDRARITRDPVLLAEYARQALGRAIVMPHVDAEQRLRAICSIPRSSRRSRSRSPRPPTASTWRWSRRAPTRSCARSPPRPRTPSPAAAGRS
jgi:Flagellar biosynthesis pathway, component FlhA